MSEGTEPKRKRTYTPEQLEQKRAYQREYGRKERARKKAAKAEAARNRRSVTLGKKTKQEWAEGVDNVYKAQKADEKGICHSLSKEEYEAALLQDESAVDYRPCEETKMWFARRMRGIA